MLVPVIVPPPACGAVLGARAMSGTGDWAETRYRAG
jgi:hypothetical protein